MARDPVDLFASKFYFSRYSCVGCKLSDRHHSNEIETIEDCIKNNESECTGKGSTSFSVHLPDHSTRVLRYTVRHGPFIPSTGTIHEVLFDYLCGADECNRHKGEKAAAEAVKKNILNGYFLIGILEDFENTLKLMEKLLPDYMKGIVDVYNSPVGQHVTETSATSHNTTVSNEVRDYLSTERVKIDHITWFRVKFEDFFQAFKDNNQFSWSAFIDKSILHACNQFSW